ncbi:hypothetical protein [Vibrio taketomensis]|nr:hypothetical protein [Vibrio taketomensis]
MKIKNLTLLAALLSTPAFANPGFFVGADFTFENDTEFDVSGLESSSQNDNSFNLIAGYETQSRENVSIIAELEYSLYGEADLTTGTVDGRGLF